MTTTTATKPVRRLRRFYGCPDWCELEDGRHDIHLTDDGHAVIGHDGPSLGRFIYGGGETPAETGEVCALEITLADLGHPAASTLSVEALRQLSADALAAADWLAASSEPAGGAGLDPRRGRHARAHSVDDLLPLPAR